MTRAKAALSASPGIRYSIRPRSREARLFEIRLHVSQPAADGQRFELPVWIPGSYMIREFARHIVSLRAESAGRAVKLTKLDKHSWQAARVPRGGALTLTYEVYAGEASVRTAYLDTTYGFFNGANVFLAVVGQTGVPSLVDIEPPEEALDWRVATALEPASGEAGAANEWKFGLYCAANYDELIDHPVLMGSLTLDSFEAGGVPHHIVLSGRHDCDTARLKVDLARICQTQIDLFGAPPPMTRYLFLTQVVGDGYGGLEHRASTALIASRNDLPYRGMKGVPDGYKTYLGLCSHEYFHTWNVKRIIPAAFQPCDLSRENTTRLLWAFEGITSYYDDLSMVRAKTIKISDYLGLLAKTISSVLKTPGRHHMSVAASSFDAWPHYYRQDANSPNAIVSYYTKGALIALALDLKLRVLDMPHTLDEVMQLLWRQHGLTGVGVPEDGLFTLIETIAGPTLARWLERVVEGVDDLPLAQLFKPFGIKMELAPERATPWLGVKLARGKDAHIATAYTGGPAQAVGLSAGDVMIALDGLQIDAIRLPALLSRKKIGDSVEIYAFRRDELMRFELELVAPPNDTVKLTLADKAGTSQRRAAWLGSAPAC